MDAGDTHVGTDTEVDLLGRRVGLERLADAENGVGRSAC